MRIVGAILGGFAVLSLLVILVLWPGYQINRHTASAEADLSVGHYESAMGHLLYITHRYPGAWLRMAQLGDCYLELNRPQEALDAYQRSLKIESKQNLKAKLGRAYFLLGNDQESVRLLKEALSTNPNDPYAQFYIALFYLKQNNYAKASFFFEGASSDPALFKKSRPYLDEIRSKLLTG